MKEELEKIIEPQTKLFREFVAELNGKTMDYETCRLLEDFFAENNKVLITAFEQAIIKLKEKVQDSVDKRRSGSK